METIASNVTEITAETFEAEVLKSDTPVLVDFWAQWCGPCRMISPIMDRLAERYAGRLKVCRVNIDEAEGLAEEYRIMSIPAVCLFDRGEIIERSIGAKPEEAFAEMIEACIS